MEILKIVLIATLSFFIILSGIFKLTGNKKVIETLGRAGFKKLIPVFGIAEIIFAILFLCPPTRNLGFILLVCYFSGALPTDLSHKNPFLAFVIFFFFLFATHFINNPSLFY